MSKIVNFIKKHDSWTIPVLLTFLISIPLIIWLKLDNSLPHWDMGRHLYNSLQYGRLWFDFLDGELSLWGLLTRYFYYPPLLYQVSFIFYLLFKVSADVAVLSNLVWIFILIFSTYNLAKSYWGRWSGLAAVLMLFSMPMIIGQMREFQLDLPLTAWVILTFYLMRRYRQQSNYKNAMILGAALGLGMLLKWTFLVFALIMVVLLKLDFIFSKDRLPLKKIVPQALVAVLLALFIALPWYWTNRFGLKADFMANGVTAATTEGDPTGFSFEAFAFYGKALGLEYLSIPFLINFLLGLYYFSNKRIKIKRDWALLLVPILVYAAFSILPNKDFRYIMPLAPFLALISAAAFSMQKSIKLRRLSITVVIIIFVFNNLTVCFSDLIKQDLPSAQVFGDNSSLYLFKTHGYTSASPSNAVCDMEKVVGYIPAESSARLVGSNTASFNNWALAYYLEKEGRVWAGEGEDISNSDFWLVRLDGGQESSLFMMEHINDTAVIKNINCRDGSLIVVLENKL